MRIPSVLLGFLAAAICPLALSAASISDFVQINLTSSVPGMAPKTDPGLINPWGISFGGATPFWVSDNGAGTATLYNGSGDKQGLIVSLPSFVPGGTISPTGTVFNGGTAFNSDLFIFASEDGIIDGWRGALGTTGEVLFSTPGANYKGLAIGSVGGNTYLYAADFANGKVTVFPSMGAPALAGNFTDPNIPSGFAPFNVQTIGTQVFVTYAKKGTGGDDDPGAGNGFVTVFNLNGTIQGRLVSNGVLNSPWGLALAPAGFGNLGGDLLVGNFGDGTINAFTTSGAFVGTIADVGGNPLVNNGLWGLAFGNSGPGFRSTSLYLTAGINGENDGLFAVINTVPEPGSVGLVLGAGLMLAAYRLRGRRKA